MSYRKKIEIYKIIEEINIPLAQNPNVTSDHEIGDHVILIDDVAYVKDVVWGNNENEEGDYSQAILGGKFVKVNTKIFEKIG